MVVLAKQALVDYIHRPLDDWTWVKKLTRQDIEKIISEYKPAPVFKTEPYLHQLQTYLVCTNVSRFGLFPEMGLGKTKIALDIITDFQRRRLIRSALVVCLNEVSVYGWEEEAQIHSDLSVVSSIGSRSDKEVSLQRTADVHLMTYAGLHSYVTKLPDKKGSAKRKRRLISRVVREIQTKFDLVVFDEVQMLMNPSSGTSQSCKAIADEMGYVYGMTGTPMGRDPKPLFGEMLVIDKGESFGNSEELFEYVFYNAVQAGKWKKKTVDLRMTEDLNRMLRHRSITYLNSECFDVPKIVRQTFRATMTAEMGEHMNDLLIAAREAREAIERGDVLKQKNVFIRQRQLTGGNLVLDPTDDSEKMEVPLRMNPKVDHMVELVESVPMVNKAIVFYEYNVTGDRAEAAIKERGVKYVRLWGQTKNSKKVIDGFKRDPNIRVLLVNWKMGGAALNLQVANYVIFLESPTSPMHRAQAEERVRPRLQERTYLYDIVIARSVDERILEFHAEGKDLFEQIVVGKEPLIKRYRRSIKCHPGSNNDGRSNRSGVNKTRRSRRSRVS